MMMNSSSRQPTVSESRWLTRTVTTRIQLEVQVAQRQLVHWPGPGHRRAAAGLHGPRLPGSARAQTSSDRLALRVPGSPTRNVITDEAHDSEASTEAGLGLRARPGSESLAPDGALTLTAWQAPGPPGGESRRAAGAGSLAAA